MGAFLFGTMSEQLIHELGCKGPRATQELLDIATCFSSNEECVGAVLNHTLDGKGKGKREEGAGEGTSDRPKKTKNKMRPGRERTMVAADR
ncbi:hypothetical protein PR202_ga00374 [Eleusine coracana subsp. coracana]|uniref:Uncharacterized protein n=1 Tax=Eleusine coracana subsp. coracana TaxID=191504 RepID=A0AAV5BED1_ELECO|nr:hypothetical protein PR202_ga00374 [Eleusine coracana subsp. coracana]